MQEIIAEIRKIEKQLLVAIEKIAPGYQRPGRKAGGYFSSLQQRTCKLSSQLLPCIKLEMTYSILAPQNECVH